MHVRPAVYCDDKWYDDDEITRHVGTVVEITTGPCSLIIRLDGGRIVKSSGFQPLMQVA